MKKNRLTISDIIRLMRCHRPSAALLLFLPCLWGHLLVGHSWHQCLWLALGSFWARSLGCVWNDWLDRSFDGQVSRTSHRPFVHGRFSLFLGVIFFLVAVGMPIVFWFFFLSFQQLFISAICVAAALIYPLCKRYTSYPQVFLGLIFNAGFFLPVIAYPFSWVWLVIYGSGILWTLEYDTLYAYQDYKDDLKLGLGSLATLWGLDKGKKKLWALRVARYGLWFVSCFFTGASMAQWTILFLGAIGSSFFLGWINLRSPRDCAKIFQWAPLEGLIFALSLT